MRPRDQISQAKQATVAAIVAFLKNEAEVCHNLSVAKAAHCDQKAAFGAMKQKEILVDVVDRIRLLWSGRPKVGAGRP